MSDKIITMGEIMLRLSPPGNLRFVQAGSFDAVYGGGEANVAVSLASFGHDACFVTKLPDNEIGQAAVNSLRRPERAMDKSIRKLPVKATDSL